MGPTRHPYGEALGFSNQYNYRGNTANLFSQSDTTPDVTVGELFYANNTGSTVISYFDLLNYAQRSADYEGKVIEVIFLDQGSTQLSASAQMVLAGSDNAAAPTNGRTHITLMMSNSSWYEIKRSRPGTDSGYTTFAGAGTTSINPANNPYIIFAGTAATTLQAISGGQAGQTVTLLHTTGGVNLTINTAGNILIEGTNATVVTVGGNYKFDYYGGSWYMVRSHNE